MEYLTPEVKKNLTSYLKTKQNALKTMKELEEIETGIFSENSSNAEFYENFTQKLGLKQKEIISFLVEEILNGKHDKSSIDAVVSEFSDYIKEVEILHVTLSVDPSDKVMNDLFEWLSKNFAKEEVFLLDYEKDDDMLAGVKVSYKGRFYDLSLNAKIEAFLSSYQFD